MTDENTIVREVQLQIRRELDRRGIPCKLVASKAGIPLSTFFSWFPAGGDPQVMGLAGYRKLHDALPEDLLSLLSPDGFHTVKAPEGVDHYEFADGCRSFLDAKARAHHPDSEDGEAIGPTEDADLTARQVRLRGVS